LKKLEQFGSRLQSTAPCPTEHTVTPKVDDKAGGIVKGQPYCKLKLITSDPNPRDRIARVATQRRWKPTKSTYGGKPQIDENTVEALVTLFRVVRGFGRLLMVEKRLSQLVRCDSFLVRPYGEDDRIHGVITPMGAAGRATNFQPNFAKFPSGNKPYGHRFRACFETYPGWVVIGADMQRLEGRAFGHCVTSLDGSAYATASFSGHPHWARAKHFGFVTNDEVGDKQNKLHVTPEGAKRFYYVIVYGARVPVRHTHPDRQRSKEGWVPVALDGIPC
jgi:hypothetical protein